MTFIHILAIHAVAFAIVEALAIVFAVGLICPIALGKANARKLAAA